MDAHGLHGLEGGQGPPPPSPPRDSTPPPPPDPMQQMLEVMTAAQQHWTDQVAAILRAMRQRTDILQTMQQLHAAAQHRQTSSLQVIQQLNAIQAQYAGRITNLLGIVQQQGHDIALNAERTKNIANRGRPTFPMTARRTAYVASTSQAPPIARPQALRPVQTATFKGPSSSSAPRTRPPLTCYHCKKPGHTMKDCMTLLNLCYNCGQDGHKVRECPEERIADLEGNTTGEYIYYVQ